MRRLPGVLVFALLVISLLLEGAVLYFMEDRSVRLYVGLALFLPIGWMFASTPVAEVISGLPERFKRRRYPRMREQVELLLAQVRRLHWTAVDGHRGFRNRKEAMAEMDAIEERMTDIVSRIRLEAGGGDEPDPEPAPDEPSVSEGS